MNRERKRKRDREKERDRGRKGRCGVGRIAMQLRCSHGTRWLKA